MDWRKLDKATIFTGKDENGNRYLSQFLRDYQKTFNPDMINAGCTKCLEDYYLTFIKFLSTMSKPKNSGYKLKEKYNGIPLEFGSPVFVSNSNLTDELAQKLIKKHPAGEDLFEELPEKTPAEEKTDLIKLTRPELDSMAEKLGINPKDYSNKGEVAAAIEDVQKAKVQSETVTGSDESVKDSEEGTQE